MNETTTAVQRKLKADVALVKQGIQKFKAALGRALECIAEAAKQYYSDIQRFPLDAPKMYSEAFPQMSQKGWDLLRRIGSGDLVPGAYFLERAASVSVIGKLPYRTQQILLGDVGVVETPQSIWDGRQIRSKYVKDMSKKELLQLIDVAKSKIRTIDQQKNYIPVEIIDEVTVESDAPYRVVGKTLIVSKKCEIGLNELKEIANKFGMSLK